MVQERKFKNGNIISLSLTNFQTFKSSVISFSPSLNFIIGPNGSGKSTISNALSLIFGGTPKTIGKTKNLKEYIRFGEHDCKIEAEISYEDTIVKVGRGISIANNFWYLNGEVVKKGVYESFIEKLQVNVNNLCQYLPQEKVSEFCRMSSEELLNSTLVSLKREDLVDQITFLSEVEAKLNDASTREMYLLKQKEELENIVKKNTEDVARIKERDDKVKKIDMMESKRTWLEYDGMVKDYKRLDNAIKALEKNHENNLKEIEDINLQITNIESNPKNVIVNEKIQGLEVWDNKLVHLKNEIVSYNQNISLLNIDLEHLAKKREQRFLDLQSTKQKIESSKEEMSKIRANILEKQSFFQIDEDDYAIKRSKNDDMAFILQARNLDNLFVKFDKTKINELEDAKFKNKRKADAITQKCFNISREVDALEDRKKKFNEAEERRLEQLKKYSYETYKGIEWLRANKGQFEDEIIEPPFLNVAISDQRFVNEIEVFLSYHALTSFICKNSRDFEKLSKILKDEKKWGVNIVEAIVRTPKQSYSTEEVKNFGFDGLVIDFIEARDEVKNFLKASCHLQNIPITKKNINDKYIFENTTFVRMAVDGKYIEIRRSKYNSKDFVISSFGIKPKNIFSFKIDTSDIEFKLAECNELRKKYNEELKLVHGEDADIDYSLKRCYDQSKEHVNQIGKLKTSINNYKSIAEQIKTFTIELKKCEDTNDILLEENNIKRRKKEYKELLSESNAKIIEILKDSSYFNAFKEVVRIWKEIQSEFKKLQSLLSSKNNLERQNSVVIQNINDHEKIKETIKPEMLKRKEELKVKPYTKDEMMNLPNTVEDLTLEIRTEKTQLKFYNVDEKVKDEYKISKKNLQEILDNIEEIEANKKQYTDNIENKKLNAIQQIKEITDRINNEFTTLFSKLACEGKIEFEHKDLDCKQWKLNILVKFREKEALEKLSSFRQSGGEKSVSTILFLLALQKIDSAPFRLVDEINQGMDKFNEKKILSILFDICESDDNTQFFIISPKLVEGLKYNKSMRVIILFSDQSKEVKEVFENP